VPEIVGDAAVIVDPDDIPALAGAIRRVLTDADLRADLRERGFRNLSRFSWAGAAEGTLVVMREAGRAELF
jgi:glycosyltransferase involved in cell wall biosynthesis